MKAITFTVPGPLFGYRQTTRHSLWLPKNIKYGNFKKKVLLLAMEAGWACHAVALKEYEVRLSVIVRWKKEPRIDWKNVYGALEDACFSEDRYVKPGKQSDVFWDTGKPEEATVILEV